MKSDFCSRRISKKCGGAGEPECAVVKDPACAIMEPTTNTKHKAAYEIQCESNRCLGGHTRRSARRPGGKVGQFGRGRREPGIHYLAAHPRTGRPRTRICRPHQG